MGEEECGVGGIFFAILQCNIPSLLRLLCSVWTHYSASRLSTVFIKFLFSKKNTSVLNKHVMKNKWKKTELTHNCCRPCSWAAQCSCASAPTSDSRRSAAADRCVPRRCGFEFRAPESHEPSRPPRQWCPFVGEAFEACPSADRGRDGCRPNSRWRKFWWHWEKKRRMQPTLHLHSIPN